MALGGLPFEQNPQPQSGVLCLVMSSSNPVLSLSLCLSYLVSVSSVINLKNRNVLAVLSGLGVVLYYCYFFCRIMGIVCKDGPRLVSASEN